MPRKKLPIVHTCLEKIVGGGQALGTLDDGRKLFAWGGLPDEETEVQLTKKKSHFAEGCVVNVLQASSERVPPHDPDSYLSTSPWQIMSFNAEQHYKAALIEEAFELHDIVLPHPITIYTDGIEYGYRNKVEFSWYGSGEDTLDLAFYRRGSKGKIPVDGTSLARPEINRLAVAIRDELGGLHIQARQLKTLLIRCNQQGDCVWQLYIKEIIPDLIETAGKWQLPAKGGEIILSDPRSPASRITKRLTAFGNTVLSDVVLNTPFRYATEGFFQINIPVYEQALKDMKKWIKDITPSPSRVIDLYAGVGSIGLTIGGGNTTLIEINEDAVREMKQNITLLGKNAEAILAPAEKAVDHITADATIIIDPPRAGLHVDVIKKLLLVKPLRIIYLSCNPVTQARDTALLAEVYGIQAHYGYNFFPRTPHIEHLIILDKKTQDLPGQA